MNYLLYVLRRVGPGVTLQATSAEGAAVVASDDSVIGEIAEKTGGGPEGLDDLLIGVLHTRWFQSRAASSFGSPMHGDSWLVEARHSTQLTK